MAPDTRSPAHLLSLIRGEFLEMPGLRLTLAQAQRLWGLERMVCEAALDALVRDDFLRRTREGSFIRRDGLAA